jgi:hypothetical protein
MQVLHIQPCETQHLVRTPGAVQLSTFHHNADPCDTLNEVPVGECIAAGAITSATWQAQLVQLSSACLNVQRHAERTTGNRNAVMAQAALRHVGTQLAGPVHTASPLAGKRQGACCCIRYWRCMDNWLQGLGGVACEAPEPTWHPCGFSRLPELSAGAAHFPHERTVWLTARRCRCVQA